MFILSLGNVDKIVQEIIASAEKEKQEIENKAKVRITELNEAASKDLDRIRNQIVEEMHGTINAENKRILGKARLESKMSLLNEKEEKIQIVFEAAIEKLKSYTQTNDYSNTLINLAVTAGVALEGGELVVSLRKEDVSKFNKDTATQKISEQLNGNVSITVGSEEPKTRIGGLLIRKGKVFVDNTFESIISRRNDKLRTTVTEILFKV
ncbi:MAG: V-type ATP synthase subunit E [Candidatus Heimdallarchaeota archaeon LC_3]|nr:MAG: V-type ATP synthase subunit E [Candidatus Heimdallarchaeota archaeon LC_3]